MADNEQYKHKVTVSRRNPYIRFFCRVWHTRPERLDFCKIAWGTLFLPLVPLGWAIWMIIRGLVAFTDRTKVNIRGNGIVNQAFRSMYDIRTYTTSIPIWLYVPGLLIMGFLVCVAGPFILLYEGVKSAAEAIDGWWKGRKSTHAPRFMTEERLERVSVRASGRTARNMNFARVIWYSLPEPVQTVLRGPWFVIKLPVLAVKYTFIGIGRGGKWTGRQLARVPLWAYAIIAVVGVTGALALIFGWSLITVALVGAGVALALAAVYVLVRHFALDQRIASAAKAFGRSVSNAWYGAVEFGRSVKYSTCPQVVVKD